MTRPRVVTVAVLGAGCTKCQVLEEHARAALEELHVDASVEHVRDAAQIARYGVERTPSLAIDGTVVIHGIVPDGPIVKEYLRKYLETHASGS